MFKVMIVDDEVAIREKIPQIIKFEEYGFTVCGTAKNGQEALDLLPKLNPDLIFLDVRMPVMDGIGFLKALRESDYEDVKVIILSGYSDFEYARKSMTFGAKGYLTKPIDEDEAIDMLKEIAVEIHEQNSHKTRITSQEQLNKLKAIYNGPNMAIGFENSLMLHLVVLSSVEDYEEKNPYELVQESLMKVFNTNENFLFRARGGVYSCFIPMEIAQNQKQIFNLELVNLLKTKGVDCVILSDEEIFSSPSDPFRQAFSKHLYAMLTDVFYGNKNSICYKSKKYDTVGETLQNEEEFLEKLKEALLSQESEVLLDLLEKIIIQVVNLHLHFEKIQELNYRIYYTMLNVVRSATNSQELNLQPLDWRNAPVFITIEQWGLLQKQLIMQAYEFIEQGRKMSNMGVCGELLDFVHIKFQEPISIKQVAEKFFMNSAYLGRVFQKATGVSFKQYVNNLRIQEAKRLLKQTDMLVYEIAQQVGFAESKYFVEKFTREVGYTPSEYRKENK